MPKAKVAPLDPREEFKIRDATLIGEHSEAVFEPFSRHVAEADFVRVHRSRGEPVVMMSCAMWRRVLLTIEAAGGG
jgi:hypothetical protein